MHEDISPLRCLLIVNNLLINLRYFMYLILRHSFQNIFLISKRLFRKDSSSSDNTFNPWGISSLFGSSIRNFGSILSVNMYIYGCLHKYLKPDTACAGWLHLYDKYRHNLNLLTDATTGIRLIYVVMLIKIFRTFSSFLFFYLFTDQYKQVCKYMICNKGSAIIIWRSSKRADSIITKQSIL